MATKVRNRKVIETLKGISYKNNGLLLPEIVVDEARPNSSPLHNYFTWDDSEAAEKYRLVEARELIAVCVEYLGEENKTEERVFCSLSSDRAKKGGYRVLVDVLKNVSKRQQLLDDALFEMNIFRKRFQRVRELVRVFSAMRAAEKKIRRKKK